MNLSFMLKERAAAGKPIRIGQVGAGKFGTMFLAQARTTVGMHVAAVADLNVSRAKSQLEMASWPEEQYCASSLDEALETGKTFLTEDAEAMIRHPAIDVVVEATGDPKTGIRLCQLAIENGKHIVMVNVEADVVAGPLLAKRARQAGVVYSLAWGDQPALACDHVDWARACGFKVVAAGKGTRYHPTYHKLTPDTVWEVLRQQLKIDDPKSINLKMFNSFFDGTKSGIEMTAICNATGLESQTEGLSFPPASRYELAEVCKPKSEGGVLEKAGVTEVTSMLYRDGTDVPHNLVMGTYVVFETAEDNDYSRRCFKEYNLLPDKSGRYAALYRPTHMIGLELGISIASAALRREPTGAPVCFSSDVIATAKRDLKAGEILDGEGGYCVWGKQTPAPMSLKEGYLPLGLAHNVKMKRDIVEGQRLRWDDVQIDPDDIAVKARREMESVFGGANGGL